MATAKSKQIDKVLKLQVKAGAANPSPPVGPTLAQNGVNIMEFCKAFNDKSSKLEGVDKGTALPVVVTVYKDKSFSFDIKTVPAATMLRKAAGIEKGSGEPNTKTVGTISKQQLQQIAEYKMPDLNAASIEAAMLIIAGTARSMGIKIEEAA